MVKLLAKYLKPFWVSVVFAILLLFGQAFCDLSLPNYMSDIVNVGIQQSGISESTPKAISAKALSFLKVFMTDEEKEVINKSYTLRSVNDQGQEHDRYVKEYPLLATQDIYVLNNNIDSDTMSQLDHTFGLATWTFIYTMQSMSSNENAAAQSGDEDTSSSSNISDINFEELYQMQPQLEAMPDQVIDDARAQAENTESSMLSQSAAILNGSIYQELGLNKSSIQTTYIVIAGMKMLALSLAGGIASILVSLLASRIAAGTARNMRRDVFRKVTSFSNNEFDEFTTSSLITRTTNDITQIQLLLVMGIRMICYAPIMAVGGTVMAVGSSPSMSWIIGLACGLLFLLVGVIFVIAMPKFKIMQKLIDKLNLVARENLNGMTVIRAFGTEDFEKKRFDKANMDVSKTQLFTNRVMVFLMPAMTFIMNGICLLVVWIGAHQVANGGIQVGDMMAFMQYSMQIIIAFLMLSIVFIIVPRAAVSAARIREVLEKEPSVQDPAQSKHFDDSIDGVVEFRNVSFHYAGADEEVLSDISFIAKPGQTTAFIGSTGSGKSTLVNLIPRFYDATSGEVLIDGVNVKDVSQHELHNKIGYVPQKGILLSGTIASNLRYGDENATMDDLKLAADIAQATDFIMKKPDGFDSPISEGGTNVSGGQKQRLSIARALTKKPEIFIFDDSFSALDFKTDATLRKALKEHTSNATVLIVAQRISTIMNAEQIIVLDEGKIVGKGTHQELLKNCKTYYEIASSQLSKEELDNE